MKVRAASDEEHASKARTTWGLQSLRRAPRWMAYAGAAGVQGLLAFLAVGIVSRTAGLSGMAEWGIQQLIYQAAGMLMSLGLPPLIAAAAVSTAAKPRPAPEVLHIAISAVLTVSLSLALPATCLLVVGIPRWFPAVLVAGASSAVLQVLTAWWRGAEHHLRNGCALVVVWLLGYLGAFVGIYTTRDTTGYWIGFACGLTFTTSVLVTLAKPRIGLFRKTDFKLLRQGLTALPHLAANTLFVGLLRPVAGGVGGTLGTASVTVAGQYAQATAILQQAYWSTHAQSTIRAVESRDEAQMSKIRRKTAGVMFITWVIHASFAPVALHALVGGPVPRTMLVMAILLGGLPLASVTYDAHAGSLWRRSRTTSLSILTVTTVAAALLLSFAFAGLVSLALLPMGVLVTRLFQGAMVRKWVRNG